MHIHAHRQTQQHRLTVDSTVNTHFQKGQSSVCLLCLFLLKQLMKCASVVRLFKYVFDRIQPFQKGGRYVTTGTRVKNKLFFDYRKQFSYFAGESLSFTFDVQIKSITLSSTHAPVRLLKFCFAIFHLICCFPTDCRNYSYTQTSMTNNVLYCGYSTTAMR